MWVVVRKSHLPSAGVEVFSLASPVQRLAPAPCSADFCLLWFIAWEEIVIPGVNGLFDSEGELKRSVSHIAEFIAPNYHTVAS